MSGPLSRGLRVRNLGGGNDLDLSQAEIFIRNLSSNNTFNFLNLSSKRFRFVITNVDSSDWFINFANAEGFTLVNANDIMTRVRANQTQVYEFVVDSSNSDIYCLTPLRLDAIWAP